MRGKVFYAFSTIFFIGLIYTVVSLSKSYQEYSIAERKLDGVEKILRKLGRDSLTPREWREGKHLFSESDLDLEQNDIPRMLTVFNQYYLQKKYLETNAGNTKVRKISWRDVVEEEFDKFDGIKSDILKFEKNYLELFEKINTWKEQLLLSKVLSEKRLDQSKNMVLGMGGLLFLFLGAFYYLFKNDNHHVRLEVDTRDQGSKATSEHEYIVSKDWDLGEIIEDMCHELKLRNKSVDIHKKIECIYESKKGYFQLEKSMRPLVKFIEFLSMDSRLKMNITFWKSLNKTYLFIDFEQFFLDERHFGSGITANKLKSVEDFMGPFDAELKLFNLVDKGSARLSVEFYNSEQKARLITQSTHQAA